MSFWKDKNFACFPDDEQELFLKAALGDAETTRLSHRKIKANFLPDKTDYALQKLYPLIYQNLLKHNLYEPTDIKFKIAHRETFQRNRLLFQNIRQVLEKFQSAKIPVILLKGAALSVQYYRSSAVRPMWDIDILIKRADCQKAIETLAESHFQPHSHNLSLALDFAPAASFADKNQNELDLHWQIGKNCWNANKTGLLWENAVPLDFYGFPTLTLSATHQLFYVCWHGAWYNDSPSIRWVADAVTILQTAGKQINWNQLVEIAYFHRVSLLIFLLFEYLNDQFPNLIPAKVLQQLKDAPLTNLQKKGNLSQMSKQPFPWKIGQYLKEFTIQYIYLQTSTEIRPRILVLLKSMQYYLRLKSLWHVPPYVFYKAMRKLVT